LDELRQRPDNEIDVLTAFMKAFENDYTHLFPKHRNTLLVNSVVKEELTRSLSIYTPYSLLYLLGTAYTDLYLKAKINPGLSQAVTDTVASEIPPCEDWTPISLTKTLLRIVAIVSGHVFIGPEMCRDERYIKVAVEFTTDVVMAVPALKRWPKFLRPLATWFEPQVQKPKDHRKVMREILMPLVEQRREAKKRGDPLPADALQWMLDKADNVGLTDITELTNMQLLLSMAAIHTTTMTGAAM
jgi:hypothetical protein